MLMKMNLQFFAHKKGIKKALHKGFPSCNANRTLQMMP